MEYQFVTLTRDLPLIEMAESTRANIKTLDMLEKEVKELRSLTIQEEKESMITNIDH